MTRKLKKWNGLLFFTCDVQGKKIPWMKRQLPVSICAYSQKDAIKLLHEHGHTVSLSHFRSYWSNCWGCVMDVIEPERGVWVEFNRGMPVKIEPKE